MNVFKSSPMAMPTRIYLVGLAVVLAFFLTHSSKALPWPIVPLWLGMIAFQILRDVTLSYQVTPDWILIHRPFWNTPLPKKELLTATLDPHFFDDTTYFGFANRRGFGYCGTYSSQRLGRFRSFVTIPENAVVLRFTDRTIVVSPEEPQAFLAALDVPRDETSRPPAVTPSAHAGYLHGYF